MVGDEYCRCTEWSIIKLEIMPILSKFVHMLLNFCQVESNNRKGISVSLHYFQRLDWESVKMQFIQGKFRGNSGGFTLQTTVQIFRGQYLILGEYFL